MFEGLLSPMHILVILVIVAIFFGAKRLPDGCNGLQCATLGQFSGSQDAQNQGGRVVRHG